MNRIAILVVTFNRIEKLKKCLKSYEEQSILPYSIFVVDNNSSDGTKDFLLEWKQFKSTIKKEYLLLNENIGGSGGFYSGIKAVFDKGDFDWIWISDDDAYPSKNAFEILNKEIEFNTNYSVICSSVYDQDGLSEGHRKVHNGSFWGKTPTFTDYQKDRFDICCFSFVGACIKKDVIKKCGFPEKYYFIWFDDTEYSIRINKTFRMLCVPTIIVFHDTSIERDWKYSWKTYYGERNKLFTIKKHQSKSKFIFSLIRYILGMVIHFFNDHKYFLSQIDALKDFYRGKLGKSCNHLPQKK